MSTGKSGWRCLKPLFFWNPAFHIWRRQVEELRELSCDRQVLVRKGYDVAGLLSVPVARLSQQPASRRRLFALQAPVVALVQTESRLFGHRSAQVLRHRMVALIEGKAERHPRTLAISARSCRFMGLTLLAAIAIQRPGDWSQDRLMLSTIVNLDKPGNDERKFDAEAAQLLTAAAPVAHILKRYRSGPFESRPDPASVNLVARCASLAHKEKKYSLGAEKSLVRSAPTATG